jgi:hypothetical protein
MSGALTRVSPSRRSSSSVRCACACCRSTAPLLRWWGPAGGREMVYFPDSVAQELDELQFSLGEGPCLDVVITDGPVIEPDMDGEKALQRWPGFGSEAAILGVRAAYAFPLRADGVVFAVLEMYALEPGDFDAAQYETATVLADAGHAAVLQKLMVKLDQTRDHATWDHAAVHQATGMVAVQLGVSLDEALSRLRAAAYSAEISLSDLADEVVDGSRRFTANDP